MDTNEVNNEQSISKSRTRRFNRNIILLIILKGGSIITSFFYVPLLLNTLETKEYALWLTLTSIVSWLIVSDIGLGNGLRNKLACSIAKDDITLGRKYIASAYTCLFLVLVFIIFAFLMSFRYVDWNSLLNSSLNKKELNLLVPIVVVAFCIQLELNLLNSILLALQMPALSSAVAFLGQFFSFIFVWIAVRFYEVNSIITLGVLISITPIIIYAFATIIFFYQKKELCPKLSDCTLKYSKDILNIGFKFFIIQIIGIILTSSNNLIITHSVDARAVVEYNVQYKYMSCIYMVFAIISTPIWSAATDAYHKGDINWIKDSNKRLLKLVGLLFLVGCMMIVAAPVVFRLWLGSDVYCSYINQSILLLYFISLSLYGCYGLIINGIGALKLQIIINGSLALLYVPCAMLFGHMFALTGVLSVLAFNQFVNFYWSRIQFNKIISGDARKIWKA